MRSDTPLGPCRTRVPSTMIRLMVDTIALPDGKAIPRLGQGTWNMGRRANWESDKKALRLGSELGMSLIDTAEMYGAAEELVGEAIAPFRDDIFLVSKVSPQNANQKGVAKACERSLKKLQTDRLDLYLLHWPSSFPIAETIEAFEALKSEGKILRWGVSNFDCGEMEEVLAHPNGSACSMNQILYNLWRRGPEFELAPWLRQHNIPLMAYSPLEQGRPRVSGALETIAKRHNVTPHALAIAWVMNQPNTIVIPKSGREDHVRDNSKAAQLKLSEDDLSELDKEFKPPVRRKPLDIL
jgi:diketogulonate reductase-like aldo/keto reductase